MVMSEPMGDFSVCSVARRVARRVAQRYHKIPEKVQKLKELIFEEGPFDVLVAFSQAGPIGGFPRFFMDSVWQKRPWKPHETTTLMIFAGARAVSEDRVAACLF